MRMISKKFYFLLLAALLMGMLLYPATSAYSQPTPASAYVPAGGGTSTDCDADAFYNALGQSESGGCRDQYTCMGPVITNGGIHQGTRPHGKYQFMPATLNGMGITDHQAFINNPAMQEAAIRQFTAENDACLERNGAYNYIGQVRNGVTITRSGLLGAAHLGGCGGASRWARGAGGASDQLGTSLADYAARFGGYGMFGDVPGGTCGGGVPNAADLFAQAQVEGRHSLIGCDPEVMQSAVDRVDALTQQQLEAASAAITQPTPVEQLTCFDQTTEIFSELGGIHSNPNKDTSSSIGPNVQQPLQNTLQQFMGGNILGGINDVINQAFSNITSQFSSLLGGLGGGGGGLFSAGPSSNCNMQEQAWLISQCIEMPQIPSLGDILGGQMGEMMGQMGNVGNMISGMASPDRLLEQVCSAANDGLQGMFGNQNDAFEGAARDMMEPVTDRVE